MSELKDNLLSSYDYKLDSNLIAQVPIEPRHSARMLTVNDFKSDLKTIRHKRVWDLKEELLPGDLLVLNNTRVIKARLKVIRPGGGVSELLLLEPKGEGKWLCLAKPAKRMRQGEKLILEAKNKRSLELEVLGNDSTSGGRIIQFPSFYSNRDTVEELLDIYGEVPLPPYIKNSTNISADRYQTRYASSPGAVAAPTAGLHLSDELLETFKERGVQQVTVTLHVGLGTFKPLDIEDLTNLKLHSEWVEVTKEVVNAVKECRSRGGRVIAVGTTSVRALESAFIAGGGNLVPLQGKVDLVIQPGYRFGVVDGLLTNFHLPKSSLLLLVSALIGRKKLLALYSKAIESQYRFFSYGDAMWIGPEAVLEEARPLSR